MCVDIWVAISFSLAVVSIDFIETRCADLLMRRPL